MVFESIVADLLNRFLGDFVDNLDASQLNIGIWGGDVKLEQLEVKETALDDFDLPVKLKYGYLSKLVLKIPWKNLYKEPVIANIDGLNLIVVPNKGVVYNEEKAKKNAAEVKQKTLTRLEEARKNRRKPPDPVADSFAEKMITQIIKNLQVKISNIHVRFEDKYTNRHRPFCMGVTMDHLDFQTTDENWKPTIHTEAVKIIHKIVSLNSLAVYWNPDSKLISDLKDKNEIRKQLQEVIHRGKTPPPGYKYILEPIQMQAMLKLNQKPENDGTDWKTPKIDLEVDMQDLSLAISKLQYQDILMFLEAQERFQLAGQYLKYRPNLNEYKEHYKAWWRFAYTAILEEKVRRRRKNWSWIRMKAHRQLVREYKAAWIKHQTEKNLDSKTTDIIKKAETQLDVFNVNVARQQAEMEIDRQGLTRLEDQPQGWVAWGKSWFGSGGSGASKKAAGGADDIAAKFQEAMTPEEKAKLFEAIDYEENMPPTNYPKHFVENKVRFRLGQTVVAVDGALTLKFIDIQTCLLMRPSANAINLKAGVRELRMDGCGKEMLRVSDGSEAWLSFLLDTKPLEGGYDQLVRLAISQIDFKYHAPAVNNAIDVFKPPESVKLNQLLAAAMSRYEDVKARSVTGLAHAVENRSKLVLDISVRPTRIFVSEGGIFDKSKPTMIADLGTLTLKTIHEDEKPDLNKSKLDRLKEQAYDKFHMKLSNVVLAFGESFDKVVESLAQKESSLHFLKPCGLDIQMHKCSIDDLQLAKIRILGNLPDIVLAFSDQRLIMLAKLLLSIPKPPPEPEPEMIQELPGVNNVTLRNRAKMRTIMEVEEIDDTTEEEKKQVKEKEKSTEQQVQLEVDLKLNQIGVVVYHGDSVLCDVSILRMAAKFQMRTFDMVAYAELGAMRVMLPTFKSLDPQRPHLYLVDNSEETGALMTLKFVQANPASPFFATEYKMTEQDIQFNFSQLTLALHQQGLMKLKAFGEELQGKLSELQTPEEKKKLEVAVTDAGRRLSRKLSSSISSLTSSPSDTSTKVGSGKRKRAVSGEGQEDTSKVIKMKLWANVGCLKLVMGRDSGIETTLTISSVRTGVKMTEKTTKVTAALEMISMEDSTPDALYSKLLSVVGKEDMLQFNMTQFQRTDEEKKRMAPTDIDMRVHLRLAQMRFVFVNLWLCRLMAWIAPFQNEAQRAAEAAQAIAAEKAAEAAQNVKQMLETSPPRIELDVALDSPLIIVPRSANSLHALIVHLGKIGIINKIMGDKNQPKAVLDRMDIKLTDMQFGICNVKKHTMEPESTCQILKPLTFTIAVHRNLMFGVVKDIPEMAVDAQLPSIELEMSEDDYKTIMQTLSGNLAEGKELLDEATPPPPPTLAPASDDSDKKKKVDKENEATPGQKGKDRMASSGPLPSEFARLLFQFTLSKVAIVLYTGVSTTQVRDPKNAFAAMHIEGLKLSGKILENTSLSVAISLNVFTMNDKRKDKTKIHQLLDKRHGHENEPFLELSFAQNEQMDKNVKLKMSAFFLCLCPEFLGCITRFFTIPQNEEQLLREADLKAKAGAGSKVAQQQAAKVTAAAAQQPQGLITLDCNMHGVEVILVEDSLRPESSQALVLSFNVKMLAEPNPNLQIVKGGIEHLAIYSSYYALERRNEITYEVLKPMNIGVELKMVPATKETNAVLRMSKMEVRMSPSIIRLLSAVQSEFAKASAVVEPSSDKESGDSFKQRTYPGYWQSKPINFRNYWFFSVAVGEEAMEDDEEESGSVKAGPIEEAVIEIEKMSFTLESGTGTIPVPLIFLDIAMSAQASGWSSALSATADLSMQMSYYNEALNVWEPVIEQVEMDDGSWERWNVRAVVAGRNKLNPDDRSPALDIKVNSDKMLNVTITKSLLSLLSKLSEVFASAAKQLSPPLCRQLPGKSPFILLNDTGLIVRVLDSEDIDAGGQTHGIEATHGAFVDLVLKKPPRADVTLERLNLEQEELSATLRLEIDNAVRELTIGRAQKTALFLPKHNEARKQWMVIAETSIENGRRLVHLVSHIQLYNHLSVPIEVYSKRDTSLDLFGTIPPRDSIHLATPLLFSPTGEIFFKPAGDKFEVSYEPLTWHNFEDRARQPIRCDLSDDTTKGFFFDTLVKQLELNESDAKSVFAYELHLHYPLVFHNVLPFAINLQVPEEQVIDPGEDVTLQLIAGHKIKLWLMYLEEKYVLDMQIPEQKQDLQVVALNTESGSGELLLGIHWTYEYGDLKAYLYAPFWFVNNTGFTLRHMEGGNNFLSNGGCVPCRKTVTQIEETTALLHPPDSNPIILPYPCDDLTKKKKAKVQVEDSSGWSEMFPLDTVGNPARILCKGKDRDYEMTVDIQLCQSGLTKIVTFNPFYLVSNLGKTDLEIREDDSQEWTTIPAEKCTAIWPKQSTRKKYICARYKNSNEESIKFPITETLETLCKINNDYVGLQVSVSTCESSVAVHLSPFQPGMTPVCIMNTLKLPVTFGQKGHEKCQVDPNQMMHFTWESVVEERVLELACGEWTGEDSLVQSKFSELQPVKGKGRRHCVYITSFLTGRQRMLLFTEDANVGKEAFASFDTDDIQMQAELSLKGFGLSVVDNVAAKEILYMAISSSDILWEEETKTGTGRFKPLAVKVMKELEDKYDEGVQAKQQLNEFQKLEVNDFEVNLANMIMKKGKRKEVKIRRIFENGIWATYGKSAQRTRIHAKINHLQIDNQLDACVFPRVLSVIPPPKSIVQDNAPKPFVELSLLQKQTEFSSVVEVEYAHILVQELAVQVDQGLLNALLALVANEIVKKPYGKEMFDEDMKMCHVDLVDTAKAYKSMKPKAFYNDLHISPLMIHLSFSQGGTSGSTSTEMPIQSELFNVFIKSVGVSLTELQDVVFKLAFFERKCVFYSSDQLNSEIISHYTRQAIKQLYVLVLGLDIIGNPFGLVRDLSAGVEDLFYQPFQGAIQGPEEFAAGVALGVQSMFGHAVGGAAGAVGRITGTVGKGVAALTFDDEYQRRRQEELNRRPANFGEGMARGVKGLGMGVVGGVTGVFTKPIEGAKQQGASGFIKGVGKGMVGLVTRPVSGVVDLASTTMATVRTVAGANKEIGPLRPPRVIRADKIIRPYAKAEAVGYKIFKDTNGGALVPTDQFLTFTKITDKMVLIVTDKQLVVSKRTDIMGQWEIDWSVEYDKIHPPEIVNNGLKIKFKEKKKGFLGLGSSEGKIISFNDAAVIKEIQQRILAAYHNAARR